MGSASPAPPPLQGRGRPLPVSPGRRVWPLARAIGTRAVGARAVGARAIGVRAIGVQAIGVLATALMAALLAAGCAGARTERNLAPLYSSHSTAGGVPEVEALGGVALFRQDPVTGERRYWAVRPLVSNRFEPDGDRFAWFLPPLGFIDDRVTKGRNVAQFLPIARYATETREDGTSTWSLLVLPGIYWAKHADGEMQRAFFPFFADLKSFLSFDRLRFFLFPLWVRTERYGRTTDYFLWPFFSVSRGTGGTGFRAWPLFGVNRWEGRYDRKYALWPIFHWQTNDIQYGEDQTQHSWMVWPLIGRARRGPASNTTVLWPLFGYTTDPETGFWAWDGPWPLVVFQGGDPDRAVRRRVWPVFSYFKGGGLTSRWWIWPIFNHRTEEYIDGDREATYVLPFWRSYRRHREVVEMGGVPIQPEDGPPGTERFRKLWPLGKVRSAPGESDVAVVDLNPFQELEFVDEHYSWLWELYTREARADQVRSRSWLGLWRREKDADEDRRSLSALWSARSYTRAGRRAEERSWLLGLVRYRTVEGQGTTLLAPAFPGPGWPMARVPSSIPADRAQ